MAPLKCKHGNPIGSGCYFCKGERGNSTQSRVSTRSPKISSGLGKLPKLKLQICTSCEKESLYFNRYNKLFECLNSSCKDYIAP